MRIAVTGATGFIGGYMVRGLAREGHQVRALCRPGRESALPQVGPDEKPLEVHVGDLTQTESLRGFLEETDLLIHIASLHDHHAEEEMQKVNVTGTRALIEDALENSPEMRFWVISSAVIGVPVYSYYRDSKRVQEKIIRGSGLEWASFRPTLVYGVGDYRHTAPLLRRAAEPKGSWWVFHEGISKINPVHVEDVVDAVIRFFDFERGVDCVYELAGPEGLTYNDFIDVTIEAVGGGVKRRNIPKKWADRAIWLKGLFKDATEDRRASSYFNIHHDHDIGNAVFELGWTPRTYAEGLKDITRDDWWRKEG